MATPTLRDALSAPRDPAVPSVLTGWFVHCCHAETGAFERCGKVIEFVAEAYAVQWYLIRWLEGPNYELGCACLRHLDEMRMWRFYPTREACLAAMP